MQTGLTDAPSSLEIYVCGPSFPARPAAPHNPSLNPPLSLSVLHPFLSLNHPFFFFSKFEIKEQEMGHKKGSNSQPTMVFSPSDYPYRACPALPPSSPFPSTSSTLFASCNPALQPGNGNQPLLILYSLLSTLYHLTSSPSSFPLLHRAPLPTPLAVMFSICFDGSSSERGVGVEMIQAPGMHGRGCSWTLHLQLRKTSWRVHVRELPCMRVCVCVLCRHISVCASIFSHSSNSCSFSAPLLSVSRHFSLSWFFFFFSLCFFHPVALPPAASGQN